MRGFVYSMPAIKDGRATQWSHMLGVAPEMRAAGLGRRLKLAQRQAALDMGLDLIEWTYDPLQAANAHLNFAKLGVVVEEYEENIYGESSSPLHRGTPTDRFVAEWRLREPHVERRIAARGGPIDARSLDCGRAASSTRLVRASPGCNRDPRISRSTRGECSWRFRLVSPRCWSGIPALLTPGAVDARDLPELLRARVPRRRLLPGARGETGAVPAGGQAVNREWVWTWPNQPSRGATSGSDRRARANGCGTRSGRRRRCS